MRQNKDFSPYELFKQMPGGFFVYNAYDNEDIIYVNDYVLKLYDCQNIDEFMEHVHGSFQGMVHPDDLEKIENEIKEQVESSLEGYDYVEYRIIQKNGQIRWVDDYGRLIHQDNGQDLFYVFIVDSTEKKQLQYELKRRHEQQQVLIDMAKDVVFDISDQNKTIDIYGKFEERFGRQPCLEDFSKLVGQHIIDENYSIQIHHTHVNYQNFDSDTDEIHIRNYRDENIWSQCQLARFYDEHGKNNRIVGRLLDTHYQILKQKHYQYDAQRDSLTGIYNRRTARHQIDHVLKNMPAEQECLLAIFDIDNFKEINDTYGHPIGDSVLKYLAYKLMEFHGHNNVYSRIGGDEFLLFISDVKNKQATIDKIKKLTTIEPDHHNYLITGIPRVTISIGIICQKGNRYNCDVLYYLADKALYGTKRQCKGQVCIYKEKEM